MKQVRGKDTMQNTKEVLKKVGLYLKKQWFVFFAIATYLFFMFYYMGPSVLSCSTTVYGFGDNTAGPIWQASLPEKQGLIGSYTGMTNAPYGDNLENPIGYSLIAQTVLIRTLTTVAGPICGYNIANMLGFVASALVMFGFIYAVTRNRWIALLAGYAVSFAPFFQLKIGAHFSFGFQAIFIGILWSFYNLINKRRKRDVVIFGSLTALAVYWDPYYSILALLIVGPLFSTWAAIHWRVFSKKFWKDKLKKIDVKRQFKLLLASIGVVLLLLAPLVAIFVSQGREISDNVSASRGNVLLETQYCSNWPHEYLVPFMFNPFFEKVIGEDLYNTSVNVLRDHYSCGIGEDVVGMSITLSVIVLLGSLVLLWERLNRRRTGMSKVVFFEPKVLIIGLVAIGVAALALSWPPMVIHGIPTPSYLMLEVTSTWRTITRIFVIINIAMIALAAIMLAYFYKAFNLKKKKILAGVLFVAIFGAVVVEYQTSSRPFVGNDFGTFSYVSSVPTHYQWLKDQSDIGTIAEYPLERSGGEGNSMAYYLTMQVTHGKKLFNGSLSYSVHEKKKTGLKNLYDPQTVPVLKAMGVDAIVVHGVTKEEVDKIPYVKIIHAAPVPSGFTAVGFSPLVAHDEVYVLSLKDAPSQDFIIAPQENFFRNMTYVRSAVGWEYLASTGGVMKIVGLDGLPQDKPRQVCFALNVAEPAVEDTVIIKVDGVVAAELGANNNPQTVMLTAKDSIEFQTKQASGVVVSHLGCGQ